MAVELNPGESMIGKWAMNMEPWGGRHVVGDLIITNSRLVFKAKTSSYGSPILQVGRMLSSTWKANRGLEVDRSQIIGVSTDMKFMARRVKLAMTDGSELIFNRGLLSVEPIVAALQASANSGRPLHQPGPGGHPPHAALGGMQPQVSNHGGQAPYSGPGAPAGHAGPGKPADYPGPGAPAYPPAPPGAPTAHASQWPGYPPPAPQPQPQPSAIFAQGGRPTAAGGTRACPFCAEEIKAEAIKCRFCKSAVDPAVR